MDNQSNPNVGFELKEKVAELSTLLLSKHPTMPTLLQQIHKTLRQYPEQVTILAPEELAIVVNGLKQQTNTMFAAALTKPSASKTKSLSNKIATLGADAF
jgi:hypothetical protein